MQRITGCIILIVFIFISGAGCKKENDKKPDCRITKLFRNGTQEYDVKYGDNEKISSIVITPGTFANAYQYKGDTTFITFMKNLSFQYRLIVTNNKKRLATNVLAQFNLSGSQWWNQAFTYDNNKVLMNKQLDYGGDSGSVQYIWDGGNPSVMVDHVNGDIF